MNCSISFFVASGWRFFIVFFNRFGGLLTLYGIGGSLSVVDKLKEEQDIAYRKHKVTQTDKGYLCEECNLNAWADDFPEYCIGPATNINLGNLDTNDGGYAIKAKLFHLHRKALIEFSTGDVITDDFYLDVDTVDLDELILMLTRIKSLI